MSVNHELIDELCAIVENGPNIPAFGVIGNVSLHNSKQVSEIVQQWPKYYLISLGTDSTWDTRTEYGRLRWELLSFVLLELAEGRG